MFDLDIVSGQNFVDFTARRMQQIDISEAVQNRGAHNIGGLHQVIYRPSEFQVSYRMDLKRFDRLLLQVDSIFFEQISPDIAAFNCLVNRLLDIIYVGSAW